MVDWLDTLSSPIEAVEHGVEQADQHFATQHSGPLTFDRIDYAAAQTYLEELSRTSSTDWLWSIRVVLYFNFSRDTDLVEDILHPTAAVLEECLTALGTVDCINNYNPNRIDFYSGEPNNSLVMAVSIQFQATTLIDPSTF